MKNLKVYLTVEDYINYSKYNKNTRLEILQFHAICDFLSINYVQAMTDVTLLKVTIQEQCILLTELSMAQCLEKYQLQERIIFPWWYDFEPTVNYYTTTAQCMRAKALRILEKK